jgi:uncharacterized protein (TIGR04255 family)
MNDNTIKYDTIQYDKHFLKQVIFRADFTEFLSNEDLEAIIDKQTKNFILKSFPNTTLERDIKINTLRITENTSPNEHPTIDAQTKNGLVKEFRTNNSNNSLKISNGFFILDYQSYINFEDMYQALKDIIKSLFSHNLITVCRSGLRYVNFFDSSEILIRKNYFAKPIAALLDSSHIKCDGDLPPNQSFSLFEYIKDDFKINFRFGIVKNNKLLNSSKNVNFVLDYDCFTNVVFQKPDEIIQSIIDKHHYIQVLFENSITDSLRRIMSNDK